MDKQKLKARRHLPPISIGWREWIILPEICEHKIKAKIDTGARTSAIHAWNIVLEEKDNTPWVSFDLHPHQRDNRMIIRCQAPLVERRVITNSGGLSQRRYIIKTTLRMGIHEWPIQLSLTKRDTMGFRMLLGRAAVRGRALIDPAASFLTK